MQDAELGSGQHFWTTNAAAEDVNEDYNTLAGILFGLGFLLVLISFGARKKKGKPTKQVEKKVE